MPCRDQPYTFKGLLGIFYSLHTNQGEGWDKTHRSAFPSCGSDPTLWAANPECPHWSSRWRGEIQQWPFSRPEILLLLQRHKRWGFPSLVTIALSLSHSSNLAVFWLLSCFIKPCGGQAKTFLDPNLGNFGLQINALFHSSRKHKDPNHI